MTYRVDTFDVRMAKKPVKWLALVAVIAVVVSVGVLAYLQWTATGPTPSVREVTNEFSAALPPGSSEDQIVAELARRGMRYSTRTTGSGEVIVVDDNVRAGARVIEARIQQHDNHPISTGTYELIVSFVLTDERKLDRLVVDEFATGL